MLGIYVAKIITRMIQSPHLSFNYIYMFTIKLKTNNMNYN